jgi:hypothetical protein
MGFVRLDGNNTAGDIVDAGDTATPPTAVYDAMFELVSEPVTGVAEPEFVEPGLTDAVAVGGPRRALLVRVGATTTEVTVSVPGVQPYSGADRADLVVAGLQNEERMFFLPVAHVAEPQSQMAIVTFDQLDGVTSTVIEAG